MTSRISCLILGTLVAGLGSSAAGAEVQTFACKASGSDAPFSLVVDDDSRTVRDSEGRAGRASFSSNAIRWTIRLTGYSENVTHNWNLDRVTGHYYMEVRLDGKINSYSSGSCQRSPIR